MSPERMPTLINLEKTGIPLHSPEPSTIFERRMSALETKTPLNSKRETRATVALTPDGQLDEEQLRWEQDEAGEYLEGFLAELAAKGKVDEIMHHDELEQALGLHLTNERHGSLKHVYDVVERPDIVAKVDRSLVEPQYQKVEQDLNEFLYAFAGEHIPEILESRQVEKDGKKASLTLTRKVKVAPKGTKAEGGKTMADLKARFDAVKLYRFLDTNAGNGVEDGTEHDVDEKTRAEVYYDDSGDLIMSDPLKRRGLIEQFVDENIGTMYTEESAQRVKNVLEKMQNKYDPDYKINPEYNQVEAQKKPIAA